MDASLSESITGPVGAACPFCNAPMATTIVEDGRDFFVARGVSDPFQVRYCSACGIGRTLPTLDDVALAPFYPAEYEPYSRQRRLLSALQDIKYKGDLKAILRRTGTRRVALFEIGAGNGAFLAVARRCGMTVGGIEPSDVGRRQARAQFDITLQPGTAADVVYDRRYDVIVLRHVLEHLNDPKCCVEEAFSRGLKPGGHLFLKLPCLDSWEARVFKRFWHGYDLPRHRFHFTRAGIERFLLDIGFASVTIEREVVPTDVQRSIDYIGAHGTAAPVRRMARVYSALPGPAKLALAQAAAVSLSPLGAGRMIVFATKPA